MKGLFITIIPLPGCAVAFALLLSSMLLTANELVFNTLPLISASWLCIPLGGTPTVAIISFLPSPVKSAPEIQHNMYKRSNTKVTEIKGSHVIYISQPEKVAEVITEAAVKASVVK
jgi:hypothetical protein